MPRFLEQFNSVLDHLFSSYWHSNETVYHLSCLRIHKQIAETLHHVNLGGKAKNSWRREFIFKEKDFFKNKNLLIMLAIAFNIYHRYTFTHLYQGPLFAANPC